MLFLAFGKDVLIEVLSVYLLCCSCLIKLYGLMVQENYTIANDTGLLLKALCCSFYESAI